MSTKIGMISLGCPKNQVDAEIMLHSLREAGYELCADEADADAIVVNTCGFIEDAKRESIEQILELSVLKTQGKLKAIVVTGCMAERYREEITKEMPEVDAVVGIGANETLPGVLDSVLKGEKASRFAEKLFLPIEGERVLTTPPYSAYIKIAEGCDNCCTYCAIPSIRGRFRSRPIENIMAEAEKLISRGVKELILVAQDTTRYGEDLYGGSRLPALLKKMDALPGIKWVRVLYTYPERISEALLDVLASCKNVVPYLDIPIQHCNAEILRRMNRRGDRAALEGLIARIREKIPEITLRTSLIAGFPGETEEQFTELCEFVKSVRFDRLGCFAYSPEEGTAAALFEPQIAQQEKICRQELIMQEQMTIAEQRNKEKIGSRLEVLVEGYDEYLKCYFGRSGADAPEIDGKVFFASEKSLSPGMFVDVQINDAIEYDLLGALAESR